MVLLLATTPALATPNFPPAIQSFLGLAAAPACTICHATNAGGEGTVTEPFGKSMQAAGLEAYNVATLDAALEALEMAGTSSVGDGVSDITKLEEGKDPNIPLNGSFGPPEPQFGCSARVARSAPPPEKAPVLVLATALFGLMAHLRRGRKRDGAPRRNDA
jgi:hypothetical protein